MVVTQSSLVTGFSWKVLLALALCILYLEIGRGYGNFIYHLKSNSFSGSENTWHLFIDCPYAQTCSSLTNLLHLVNDCANNTDSFLQWFFCCLECCLSQQWINARTSSQSPHNLSSPPDEALRWQRPPSGYMKCNIDAAIFKEIYMIGVAAVIPDSNGAFIVCRMHKYHGLIEVREA